MELSQRLMRIENARIRNERQAEEDRQAAYELRCDFCDAFLKYSDKIKELIEVGNHLLNNGFLLGEKKSWDKAPTFVSEGINHRFGFVCNGNPYTSPKSLQIKGLGYVCGGCDGVNNFILSENGVQEFSEYVFKTKGFVTIEKDLLDFEKRFYEYVDSL